MGLAREKWEIGQLAGGPSLFIALKYEVATGHDSSVNLQRLVDMVHEGSAFWVSLA